MFITAVCVVFLVELQWPKTKSLYDTCQGLPPWGERKGAIEETCLTHGGEIWFSSITSTYPLPPPLSGRGIGMYRNVEYIILDFQTRLNIAVLIWLVIRMLLYCLHFCIWNAVFCALLFVLIELIFITKKGYVAKYSTAALITLHVLTLRCIIGW